MTVCSGMLNLGIRTASTPAHAAGVKGE